MIITSMMRQMGLSSWRRPAVPVTFVFGVIGLGYSTLSLNMPKDKRLPRLADKALRQISALSIALIGLSFFLTFCGSRIKRFAGEGLQLHEVLLAIATTASSAALWKVETKERREQVIKVAILLIMGSMIAYRFKRGEQIPYQYLRGVTETFKS